MPKLDHVFCVGVLVLLLFSSGFANELIQPVECGASSRGGEGHLRNFTAGGSASLRKTAERGVTSRELDESVPGR